MTNANALNIKHDLKVPETISGISRDVLVENVKSSISRGLPELSRGPWPMQTRAAAVVTGGPSINMMMDDVRKLSGEGAAIFTVKAVWRWLMNIGVAPDFCAMIDPHPSQAVYTDGAPKGMTWLVASQCHPSVFDALARQGADVMLFHVPIIGADNPGLLLPDGTLDKTKMLVPGGGGVGSRTVRMAALMRHRPLHLFGFDCCYQNGSSADPARIQGGAIPSHVYRLARGRDDCAPIEMNGRIYLSTWAFLTETVDIMQLCASSLIPELYIHGPGMLADTIREFMSQQRMAAERKREMAGLAFETFASQPARPFTLADRDGDMFVLPPSTDADAMASARAAD